MGRLGIGYTEVAEAAQKLHEKGLNATVDAVRMEMGNTGSKSTIAPLLRRWREALQSGLITIGTQKNQQSILLPNHAGLPLHLVQAVQNVHEQLHLETQMQLAQALEQGLSVQNAKIEEAQTLTKTWKNQFDALFVENAETKKQHSDTAAQLNATQKNLIELQKIHEILQQQHAEMKGCNEQQTQHIQDQKQTLVMLNRQQQHWQNAVEQQRQENQLRFDGDLAQLMQQMQKMQQNNNQKNLEIQHFHFQCAEQKQKIEAAYQQIEQLQQLQQSQSQLESQKEMQQLQNTEHWKNLALDLWITLKNKQQDADQRAEGTSESENKKTWKRTQMSSSPYNFLFLNAEKYHTHKSDSFNMHNTSTINNTGNGHFINKDTLVLQGFHPDVPRRLSDFKLIAFDMDSTLINIECIDEIAGEAGKKTEVSAITEAAMQGQLTDFKASLRQRLALLKGVTIQQMEDVYTKRLQLNPGAEVLVKACQDAGLVVILVSGGFTFFAEKIQQRLGLDFIKANALEIEQGVLTGRLIPQIWGDICDGEEKRRTISEYCEQLGITPAQAIAVGDGANDLPMMQLCAAHGGISVAFHAKPAVREQAMVAINAGGLDRLLEVLL